MAKKTLAEKMAENSRNIMETLKFNTVNSFSTTEEIKNQLLILDELRDLIPPLLDSELDSLRESLINHGCKDPLKVWQTNNGTIGNHVDPNQIVYVLIDGHNRYKLCNELKISFNIQIDHFDSIEDVRNFMIDFQLSRRNINPLQASFFRGLRYQNQKKNVTQNFKSEKTSANSKTTAQELGEIFKVDEKTIRRDAIFADGMNKLEPSLRNAILSNKLKVDKNKVQTIGLYKSSLPKISTISELNEQYNSIISRNLRYTIPIQENILQHKYNFIRKTLSVAYKSKKISAEDAKRLNESIVSFINILSVDAND